MTYPCPQCGARKGEAHDPKKCTRAQNRRKPGFGKLPRMQQGRYERHTCTPYVYYTKGDNEFLKCKVCYRKMGKRKKG